MVNPNLMDAIDKSLKVNRENDLPFGGVQMLFVGDVFQLAPIAKDKEKEVLEKMYPEGNFFFNSKWFKILNPKRIEFERIFRQKDADFIQKLDRLQSLFMLGWMRRMLQRACEQADATGSRVVLVDHIVNIDPWE